MNYESGNEEIGNLTSKVRGFKEKIRRFDGKSFREDGWRDTFATHCYPFHNKPLIQNHYTMKRFALLLAGLVAVIAVNAQTETGKPNEEINTVFGKGGKTKIGWFIGIDPGYTQFDKRDVWLGGMSVGMVIDHNFTVGLTGRGWCNRDGMYYPNVTDTAGAYLEGGYGGLLLEYTLFPKSIIHVTFPVVIGAGGATYTTDTEYKEWNGHDWDTHYKTLCSDAFFVIEPGVRAELNVFKFMRLNAGISYRYVGDLQMVNTPSDLMNNFTATVGLKFGKF
jgi:hypothetical protein